MRARLLIQIGDLDQALKDTNDAIATLPDEVTYYVRGNIYELKGELAKAIDDYTRADRILPGQQHVIENRATVYERLGRTEEAQKDRKHAEWLSRVRR